MKNNKDKQITLFKNLSSVPFTYGTIIFNKEKLVCFIEEINDQNNLLLLKNKIIALKGIINSSKSDQEGLLNIDPNGDTTSLRRDVLTSELNQILESKTLERAKYYLKRLERGVQKIKTSKVNDINLLRWKEYDEIMTDSLWVLDKRESSGAHTASYWGNFVPQIPHQMMLRYTKKDEWVLDTFVGSGTTLIECKRLGRNGIGIDLNSEVVQKANELVSKEYNKYRVTTEIIAGDNRIIDIKTVLGKYGIKKVQLLIMHPPYHDIIKFSNDKNDLSRAGSNEEFLEMFGESVDNVTPFLEKGRYFALVIGDKYSKSEWIPLGFYCMQEVLKREYLLKSIIIKNFGETRGKRNQGELWRYRALVGGFYIFKHEYVMLFKKK